MDERRQLFDGLLVELHEAARQGHWRDVILSAEKVLALAPQHPEARQLRARAWKSVEPKTMTTPPPRPELARPEPSRRYLLWVDGVGGYLVCLGEEVTVGQAAPLGGAEVPLQADVSRRHLTLSRDPEGYLLEALRPAQVNGKFVERTLLRTGDQITLGACQLLFSQPVPVSATAQLEVVSGHRLSVAVGRVFLMADTLVLGPAPQSHVIVPDLGQPVILFRTREGLGVRHAGGLTVNGQPCLERGALAEASQVAGEEFAFAVEPFGQVTGRV